MYAIIRTGGKQAKVRPGDVLEVELLKGAEEQVSFTPLLVVDGSGSAISDRTRLGDLTVTARVLGESKGPKIDIFKYKNKTGYRRRMGHRQRYTQIEVLSIGDGDGSASKGPAKKNPAKKNSAEKSPRSSAKKASAGTATGKAAGEPATSEKPADPAAASEEE